MICIDIDINQKSYDVLKSKSGSYYLLYLGYDITQAADIFSFSFFAIENLVHNEYFSFSNYRGLHLW